MAFVAAALVAAGHAWSIPSGLFLDDHAHYRQLREGDWSYRSAVAAARLGIVGDVMDLWSRQETGLRFYRPIAFWIMRAEYTAGRWNPAVMHGFSLAWHWLCAMLVGMLAWHLIGRWTWAGVAACLMAVHPGHVVTVYWIACQTELMATAFILLATLSYARYAGWWRARGQRVLAAPQADEAAAGEISPPDGSQAASAGAAAGRNGAWLTLALAFYALAMGCREHAIMWPAVIVTGDAAFGAERRRRLRAYALAALLAVVYLLARQQALHGFPLPGRPYLMRPGDPGFARYIVDKLVYYMIGVFAYVPVLPIAGTDYFRSHPGAFYGTFAGVAVTLLLILSGAHTRRPLLFLLAWTAVFFVPLLPVFASMHHLYLPSVGAVCLLAAGLAVLAGPSGGPRRVVAWVLAGVNVAVVAGFTWGFGRTYTGATRVEDMVVRDVIENGRPLRDGDHLFFINLPMLAYYAIPAIENATGRHDLHGHVLTVSPWLLRMEKPAALKRLDDRTIELTAPPGAEYFGGVAGRTLLAVMGFTDAFRTGDCLSTSLFVVEILEADTDGIRRLRFRFRESVDSPRFHFFFGSPVRWAYPVLDNP